MNAAAYHFFELALVGAAVGFSGWRVWARYFRQAAPPGSAPGGRVIAAPGGCSGCGSKSGCSKPG